MKTDFRPSADLKEEENEHLPSMVEKDERDPMLPVSFSLAATMSVELEAPPYRRIIE